MLIAQISDTHIAGKGKKADGIAPTAENLTLERPSQFFLEAPGYQLHYWIPERNLVSYTIYVREVDGPYLFKEHPKAGGAVGR